MKRTDVARICQITASFVDFYGSTSAGSASLRGLRAANPQREEDNQLSRICQWKMSAPNSRALCYAFMWFTAPIAYRGCVSWTATLTKGRRARLVPFLSSRDYKQRAPSWPVCQTVNATKARSASPNRRFPAGTKQLKICERSSQ